MESRRWGRLAVVALLVAVALFFVPNLLVLAGAPIETVVLFSNLSLLTLLGSLILFAGAASSRVRWLLIVGSIAVAGEVAAALLLLVHEPQPAYLHPEWAWYWPVVNTLYLGGLVAGIVVLFSAGIALAQRRGQPAAVALLLALAAVAVNRVAPYR